MVTDGEGMSLHRVSAGTDRHDAPLLRPTLAGLDRLDGLPEEVTIHLTGDYTGAPPAALPAELGFTGAVARQGRPAPVQAGARWVVERTHAWMKGSGPHRRCTERCRPVIDCYLFLAAAVVVVRRLPQRARLRYCWPGRPTTRRLKSCLAPCAPNPSRCTRRP